MVEFYVPATFQFSTESGRIERILVGLFHEQGNLEAQVVTEEPTTGFYIPAMYQFSTEPGRIERFLNTVFAERGEQEFKTVPERFMDIFYLPASNPMDLDFGAATARNTFHSPRHRKWSLENDHQNDRKDERDSTNG